MALLTKPALSAVASPTAVLGGRVGDKFVNVTPGATAGAANLYAEGYLGGQLTPGNGINYQGAGHAAITRSVAFNVNLMEAIQVAYTSPSKANLTPHPYQNLIQAPVTT